MRSTRTCPFAFGILGIEKRAKRNRFTRFILAF